MDAVVATPVDWREVAGLLDELYRATDRLEEIFPGRSFTLDGHLVDSIGEVIAAYMFDLKLSRASRLAHDALAAHGRRVEIKLTQGQSAAIRHPPDHLLVLHRPKGGPVRVVYNGPGDAPWDQAGKKQSNGQRTISLRKLAVLDQLVVEATRLTVKSPPPV
jgi:hypothetical protein